MATRPLPRTPEPERRLIPRIRSHRRNKTLPNISLPTNVVHTVHVVFNPVTGDLEVGQACRGGLGGSRWVREEVELSLAVVYGGLGGGGEVLSPPARSRASQWFSREGNAYFFLILIAGEFKDISCTCYTIQRLC